VNSQIVPIEKHRFTSGDKFLFDTNIWMFINGPMSNAKDPKVIAYSNALKEVLSNQGTIFIDALILSEFVNRYARLEHSKSSSHHNSRFKEFRQSDEFKKVASDIRNACGQILKNTKVTDTDLSNSDIVKILDTFEKEPCDLNDQILLDICKRRGYILVTHDIDSSENSVAVLTANRKMISQASKAN
jgi:predicted nucleic acid-binding protein